MTDSHAESTVTQPAPTEQPERVDLRSHDIITDKQSEIVRLFPEVRTEGGKIDFDRLKRVLGETVDPGKERYGMNWPGKADCFKAIQSPSLGTLLPCRGESMEFDKTENLIIEGDNLEVLKLIQKSYLGKVKMIYIDPPFNTGNDFIYPDNYSESLQTYLEYTGQVDSEGRKFSTNTDADGRFHSKWLNMMYPRLFLAWNLLRDDGMIFISIDDHEIENLKHLCNALFGEESFLSTSVWRRRQVADSRNSDRASIDHEYVVCYKKPNAVFRGQEIDISKYSNPDNDPRGPWTSGNLTGLANQQQRPNLHYVLINPITGAEYPPSPSRGWARSQDTMGRLIAENRILWPSQPKGRPRLKQFLSEVKQTQTGFSSYLNVGTTMDGTRAIQELFGEKVFPFSKPVELLHQLLDQATHPDSIVLDFFAGSGTTAQAVLELNKKDGGDRKFILIQLPEPTGITSYPTISEIAKERVRRVVRRLDEEETRNLPLENVGRLNRGFRSFKLAESNFQAWIPQTSNDPTQLVQQLEMHVAHIRGDRSAEDILTEVLLKSGFPLAIKVQRLSLCEKDVYSVSDGAMLVCLEKNLTPELMKAIADMKPQRVICLDEGFAGNDQLKTNAVQTMKSKGVTSFRTV